MDQGQDIAAQLGLENYSSMEEHRGEALLELQRYEEKGIARMVSSEELLQRFPTHGTISRLAMILKQKDDGTVKSRIIMDLRRSGGNSRCKVPERIVLPRVSDVVDSLVWMRNHRGELQGALGQRGYTKTCTREEPHSSPWTWKMLSATGRCARRSCATPLHHTWIQIAWWCLWHCCLDINQHRC